MTLRHDIKIRSGDSWSSPTWAVILPGGLGVDLTDDWSVRAQVRTDRNAEESQHDYRADTGGIELGTAAVTLSNGTEVDTSTVTLYHTSDTFFPVFVGLWDCAISKGSLAYTLVEGSFRVVTDVTR